MPFFMVDPFLVVTHLNERMEKLTVIPATRWWPG